MRCCKGYWGITTRVLYWTCQRSEEEVEKSFAGETKYWICRLIGSIEFVFRITLLSMFEFKVRKSFLHIARGVLGFFRCLGRFFSSFFFFYCSIHSLLIRYMYYVFWWCKLTFCLLFGMEVTQSIILIRTYIGINLNTKARNLLLIDEFELFWTLLG